MRDGILAFVGLLVAPPTLACTCDWPRPPREALVDARAVFVGQVVARDLIAEYRYRTTFELDRVYKGDRAQHIEVYDTGWNCDYPFEDGESYLVYAYGELDDRLYTSICSRTKPAWRAALDTSPPGFPGPITDVPAAAIPERLLRSNTNTKLAALSALALYPDAIDGSAEGLRNILTAGTVIERRTALDALEYAGERGLIVLPKLVDNLQHDSLKIRTGSANVIAAIGPRARDAVPALIVLLEDEAFVSQLVEARERLSDGDYWRLEDEIETSLEATALALGAIGPYAAEAAPTVLNAIERGRLEPDLARVCLWMGAGVEAARDHFVKNLTHDNSGVRAGALSGLAALGPAAAGLTLAVIALLEDTERYVRMEAAEALGHMGEPTLAVPALIEVLERDHDMHWSAVTALAALGESERIVPLFLEGLVFPDKAERLDASAATPLFLEALSHPSKDVRAQSAECLGVVGGRARYQNAPRAAGILEGLARDDAAPRVRAEILTAMVRIAPESEDVAARLLAALGDESPTVRQRAASAIKALPVSDKIVSSVTAALEDPDASVRRTAAATLGDLGQAAASAVEALVELTDDPDRAVRGQAVRALGRIGELAHEAAPVLWRIAHEPDDGLAEDAWFALEFLHAIGPSQTTRKVMFFLFALTGVSAAWLMRRLWFHGIGGRGTRWMMATSAAFAIILGWELLEARAKYPYERPGFLERIDTIPFATNDLVLAIGNPRGHEDAFGYALAAMPDALVVGTLDDGAYIYEPSGELRARLDRPDSDGDDFFGSQVAAAGTNVVVAAPQDDQIVRDAGAVFLFDGATGELRTRIDNPTPLVRELFGEAVAASDDRILVAGPWDRSETGTGAVYLFDMDGALLLTIANPEPERCRELGSSLAFLGESLVVGEDSCKLVFVFGADGSQSLTLQNPEPGSRDSFGHAVATLGDDVLVTDGRFTYLFDGTSGELILSVSHPEPSDDVRFGGTVAAIDGARFAVGATERVFIFDRSGAVVQDIEWPRLPRTGIYQGHFGSTLAVMGGRLVVAAPQDDAGFVRAWAAVGLAANPRILPSRRPTGGAVYVFETFEPTEPTLLQRKVGSSPPRRERYRPAAAGSIHLWMDLR